MQTEPIILVTSSGYLDVSQVGQVFEQSRALIGDDSRVFYRITEMDGMTLSFTDLPQMLIMMTGGGAGSTSDPQIRTLLVGTTGYVEMLRDLLAQPQHGGLNVLAFRTRDEAVAYAQAQSAANDGTDSAGR
jgi:hypothetical protein